MSTSAFPPRQAFTLACRNLVREAGGARLLDQVSLSFAGPGFVGVLGPNGAGKSTLLRALAGYAPADAGEVLWNGRPVQRWSGRERAAACGYLPQQLAPAWNYSVDELLAMGAQRAGDRLARAPEIIRADFGLDSLAKRRWSALSGGERARVMLAATVANAPPLVLADEPGASLDLRHKLDLLARLKQLTQTALVVVVMHDLDLALRFCDRIVLMERGKVAADGPPAAMLAGDALDRVFSIRLQTARREPGFDQVIGVESGAG